MNATTRPTKTAEKTRALRLAALDAELAEVAGSDRPDGVKALMTRCVAETRDAVAGEASPSDCGDPNRSLNLDGVLGTPVRGAS